jgi:hypothetical protein
MEQCGSSGSVEQSLDKGPEECRQVDRGGRIGLWHRQRLSKSLTRSVVILTEQGQVNVGTSGAEIGAAFGGNKVSPARNCVPLTYDRDDPDFMQNTGW